MQKEVENNDLNIDFRFLQKLDDNKPGGLSVLTFCTTYLMYISPLRLNLKNQYNGNEHFPVSILGNSYRISTESWRVVVGTAV
jgi:hypothetical protein